MKLFRLPLVVHPWTVVLERLDGQPTVVLPAGRHAARPRASYEVVDLREQLTALSPQEVPTDDGLTVKISAAVRWRVTDPVAYAEVATDALAVVYLSVQVALRELAAGLAAEDVATAVRAEAAAGLVAAVRAEAARVGIEVLAVDVKDVLLPFELRQARAELVVGRHRAQVKLEEARAETAALRSLANGAKLLADNPALARLRLVQALPHGTTLELRADD
ncbi:SPFH domain-containing protein [Nocardioides sp. LML1-1-1.1]|uniref:SPFH domain-containing protein n=1 Tax=Nocardioides sp. LML1-1-1.1 TaxID=3135248 RepID=UPI00341A89F1